MLSTETWDLSLGRAFGMDVVMTSLSTPQGGEGLVSLEELRTTSDVLSTVGLPEKAGAFLDVLCDESLLPGNPLPGLENCIVTGHMVWSALEARRSLISTTKANVRAFLNGFPIHVINSPNENPHRPR